MECIQTALFYPAASQSALQHCLTFTHSFIHTFTHTLTAESATQGDSSARVRPLSE